jgi:myo-inositol 2-dehydrogenase/D-chiro-inositol 1-dehydrogenase
MNFALLGDDSRLAGLALAVVAQKDHRLLLAVEAPETLRQLLRFDRRLQPAANWSTLLDRTNIDAVLIGTGHPDSQFAAKQLAAAGVMVLMFPDVDPRGVLPYELWMAHPERTDLLFPILPHRGHPVFAELQRRLSACELGPLHHLELQRTLPVSESMLSVGGLRRDEIDAAFVADIDRIRFLFGEYDQVTAVETQPTDGGVARSTITLSAEGQPQLNWTATPSRDGSESWRLVITGQNGSLRLDGGPDSGCYSLLDSQDRLLSTATDDGSAWVLSQCVETFQTRQTRLPWSHVTRCFDLLDGVHRSLKRRRTIDVHFENVSERSHFKSQMTAVGCSLLMTTPVLLAAVLLASALVDLPRWFRTLLPLLVLTPLALFLLLQGLMYFAKGTPPRKQTDTSVS